MKKILLPALFVVFVVMCGCTYGLSLPEETTTQYYEYEYLSSEETSEITTVTGDVTEPISSEAATQETTTVPETVVTETAPQPSVTENVTQESTTVADIQQTEEVTEESTTGSFVSVTEVDLSIDMPDKNGTMETDSSPDNKYIGIVSAQRGIDTSLLVAVYSVPESGQNYVFEFNGVDNRDSDAIRRVYLIDSEGKITSVAAAKSSEKENLSSVENWFCMNVLIKEVIFPALAEEIQ